MLRLASRKHKKDTPVKQSPASVQDINMWTITHVLVVKDLVEIQYKQYLQVSISNCLLIMVAKKKDV